VTAVPRSAFARTAIPRARIFTEHPRDRAKLAADVETHIKAVRAGNYIDGTAKITWLASGDFAPLLHCVVEWAEWQPEGEGSASSLSK
jgi:hypothetical protein